MDGLAGRSMPAISWRLAPLARPPLNAAVATPSPVGSRPEVTIGLAERKGLGRQPLAADGLDEGLQLGDMLGDPRQFFVGDDIVRRVACIDIGLA